MNQLVNKPTKFLIVTEFNSWRLVRVIDGSHRETIAIYTNRDQAIIGKAMHEHPEIPLAKIKEAVWKIRKLRVAS